MMGCFPCNSNDLSFPIVKSHSKIAKHEVAVHHRQSSKSPHPHHFTLAPLVGHTNIVLASINENPIKTD